MIKNILLTSIIFIAVAFGFSSCTKVNCNDLTIAITTSADAYKLNGSAANCQTYKKAIQAWLNESKCSEENAVQTNAYRSILNSLANLCP